MGRGSGADVGAEAAAVARKPVSELPLRISDKQRTTLQVLFKLSDEQPEADGFSLQEIAEAGLPEMSPKEREGFYRLIAETADALVDQGFAECNIEELGDGFQWDNVRWKITDEGQQFEASVQYLTRMDELRAAGLPTF